MEPRGTPDVPDQDPPEPAAGSFDDSGEFARALFDALAEGVLVVDDAGRIMAMNTSAEQLLGFRSDTLAGRDVRDSPWVLEDEQQRRLEVEEWPIIATLESGTPSGRLTVTVRPDGSRRTIVMVAMPLPRPRARHWTVVSLADVTRQRRAELALAASEGRFRQLVEQAPDAVVVVDETGTITTCNQRTADVFGYPPTELVGAPIELLVPDAARATHQDRRAEFVRWPSSRPMGAGADLSGRRKDGSEFPIEVSLGAMDTPEGRQVVAIARDLTERRRAQEMVVADRAKSEFLSRMSHELRTPLNSILGFTQLLDLTGPRPDQTEALEQIQHAGHHLLDLLNDLLEFERVRAGHVTYSIEPVCLPEVVSEALQLIEPLAQTFGIRTFEVDGSVGADWAACDRLRLRQVLLNLLSNAVKYNVPDGIVAVTTRRHRGEVHISIRDTGHGIPAEQQERLFAPFERLGTDPEVEGAGVGLALSKMLVEGMGGRILVESEAEAGSTFTVTLPPSERAALNVPVPPAAPTPAGIGGSLAGLRVLYVEDNAANVRVVAAMLDVLGVAETLTAATGEDGLAIAARARPDVILLDLHLPDLSGDEVHARLRGDDRTAAVPVVVVTADASPASRARLLDAGVHRYVTKPIDVTELYEAIAGVAV